MKRQTASVAALLFSLVAVCTLLTAVFHPIRKEDDTLQITASFYPLYTVALQVVGDVGGVSVSCLTAPTAGCLHNYQLSPDELAALSRTDVLLLNGAGMEDFLSTALAAYPAVQTVDTSVGISLLDGDGNHGHAGHEHHENEHVWLSPARYKQQIEAVRDALCERDPQNAAAYTQNAARYLEAVTAAGEAFAQAIAPLKDWETVLFHDSVAYVAADANWPVVASLPLSENSSLSAHTLAQAAAAARGKQLLLLYDKQFADIDIALDAYAARTKRVVWDTAVTPQAGVADRDRWLWAMEQNINEVTTP